MLASLIVSSVPSPIEQVGRACSRWEHEEDHFFGFLNKQALFDPALNSMLHLRQALRRKTQNSACSRTSSGRMRRRRRITAICGALLSSRCRPRSSANAS